MKFCSADELPKSKLMDLKDTRPMKAYLEVNVMCPDCGGTLVSSLKTGHHEIACQNEECLSFGLIFQRPSVTLHRAFDDDGEQKRAE